MSDKVVCKHCDDGYMWARGVCHYCDGEGWVPAVERYHIDQFTGGWFIGDFEPSLLNTSRFEVSVKNHPKGEKWDRHTHKIATEYNYVASGRVKVGEQIFETGDIFVVKPFYVMDPEFLDDCVIVCIKTPSVKGDKYICD